VGGTTDAHLFQSTPAIADGRTVEMLQDRIAELVSIHARHR